EHHERGDDPRGLGRIEPGGGQRDVGAPVQLPLRRGCVGRARNARDQPKTGESEQIAPGRVADAVAKSAAAEMRGHQAFLHSAGPFGSAVLVTGVMAPWAPAFTGATGAGGPASLPARRP